MGEELWKGFWALFRKEMLMVAVPGVLFIWAALSLDSWRTKRAAKRGGSSGV